MNITVGRYDPPTDEQRANPDHDGYWPADRYDCWVQSEGRGWTLFVDRDTGAPILYVAAGDGPLGTIVYPPADATVDMSGPLAS